MVDKAAVLEEINNQMHKNLYKIFYARYLKSREQVKIFANFLPEVYRQNTFPGMKHMLIVVPDYDCLRPESVDMFASF